MEYHCCSAAFFEHIVIIVVLVLFAGLMSGLTLGLMSLSLVDLEVLAKSGTEQDRKHAGTLSYPPTVATRVSRPLRAPSLLWCIGARSSCCAGACALPDLDVRLVGFRWGWYTSWLGISSSSSTVAGCQFDS